ncbi:hypothetical protein ACJX4H_002718 [Enterococcus faecium]|nr:hypothetical protein [Enterococcus faecium]
MMIKYQQARQRIKERLWQTRYFKKVIDKTVRVAGWFSTNHKV